MKQTYILAISGGVDSVVLLDKLASVRPEWICYIIAHVNHGIRPDSDDDETFVSKLAEKWGLEFESIRLELGKNASEAVAREKRYDFLFMLLKKYKAEKIITAHHEDDVLETMILNMLRGTSPRGLVGFQRKNILRPFLHTPKHELVNYATTRSLTWREDSTNSDEKYLRNYVRKNILPKFEEHREDFIRIRDSLEEVYLEIDTLTKRLLVQSIHKKELVRARFVILPVCVQKELVASWLRLHDVAFDAKLIERAVVAMKTFASDKHFELSAHASLTMKKHTIVLNVSNHAV